MKKLIHTAAYLAVILTVISAFFGCKTTGAAVAKTAGLDYTEQTNIRGFRYV